MTLLDVFSAEWWRDYFLPWMVGVSTAVGVGAAIIAGIYAARAFGREQARDQRREDEALREHASRVTAWTSYVHVMLADGTYKTHVRIYVRNASDQPIYQTVLSIALVNELVGTLSLGVVPPQSEAQSVDAPVSARTAWTRWLKDNPRWVQFHTETGTHTEGANVEFTDAGGNRWTRMTDGALYGPELAFRRSPLTERGSQVAGDPSEPNLRNPVPDVPDG